MHIYHPYLALVRHENGDGSVRESRLTSHTQQGLADLIHKAEVEDGFLSCTSYQAITYFESDRSVERAANGLD